MPSTKRPRSESSVFDVPRPRRSAGGDSGPRESNVLPAECAAEQVFRDAVAGAGAADLCDRLVRALVRAKTAPRQRTPTEVIASYIETMTFASPEAAQGFFDALAQFWEAVDRDATRPTAETDREKAEDLLEMARAEQENSEDLRKIRRLLRQAVEADPGWWEPHLELAELEFHAFNNEEQARIHYGRALETSRGERPAAPDPEVDPAAWSWDRAAARPYLRSLEALADYHAEKEEWDKARRYFEKLLRHDGTDPLKVSARLAEMRERTGDAEGALAAYQAVIQASGASEPGALYAAGRLEVLTGKLAEARRDLWRGGLAQPWAAAALLDIPFEGELDPDAFPEIEWIEIGLGYAERCDELWRKEPKAVAVLRSIWNTPQFAAERSESIRLAAAMMSTDEDEEPPVEAKQRLHELLDPKRISGIAGR